MSRVRHGDGETRAQQLGIGRRHEAGCTAQTHEVITAIPLVSRQGESEIDRGVGLGRLGCSDDLAERCRYFELIDAQDPGAMRRDLLARIDEIGRAWWWERVGKYV